MQRNIDIDLRWKEKKKIQQIHGKARKFDAFDVRSMVILKENRTWQKSVTLDTHGDTETKSTI